MQWDFSFMPCFIDQFYGLKRSEDYDDPFVNPLSCRVFLHDLCLVETGEVLIMNKLDLKEIARVFMIFLIIYGSFRLVIWLFALIF